MRRVQQEGKSGFDLIPLSFRTTCSATVTCAKHFYFWFTCILQFTITRYTNPHPDIIGGLLCGPCDKEIGPASGQVTGGSAGKGGAGAGAAGPKKRARAVKNKGVSQKDKPSVMSLTKCCIEVIGKAIEDVEEFGDIGEQSP